MNLDTLRNLRIAARRIRVRLRFKRELPRLIAARQPELEPVIAAAQEMAAYRIPAEEKDWIARIECLRGKLGASRDEIEVTRFHAYTSSVEQAVSERDRAWTVRTTVGKASRRSSVDRIWGLFLMKLVRAARPSSSLELGTAFGISAAYQAAGLELAGNGRLVTLEGDETLCSLARAHLEELGLAHRVDVRAGPVRENLGDVLRSVGEVDYAFIDASHNEAATFAYLDELYPFLKPGAVIVFDDIHLSAEMKRAWAGIETGARMRSTWDLGRMGVAVFGGGRSG
jgi:predicted O-methyltransferase YrrM